MKSKLTLLTMFLWVASIVLYFTLPPTSRFLWMPDTLLLFGFYPLLIKGKARWLWILFGILNIAIGWFLAMAYVMPAQQFAPYHLEEVKKHIDLYHPLLVWLFIGVIALLIGIVRVIMQLVSWLRKKFK